MRFSGTRRERHADNPPLKFRKHIVAQLAVAKTRVLPRHRKPAVEHPRRIAEVVAMRGEVRFPLRVVSRAGTVPAHLAEICTVL